MSPLFKVVINKFKYLIDRRFLVLSILLLLADLGFSQLDDTHYFPAIHSRQNGQIGEQYVYLSTPEPSPFLVTLADGEGNFIASATISQDNPADIYIGNGQFPGTECAVPRDSIATVLKTSGFIATADHEFYCNVRIKSAYQATSIACKGKAALGQEFYAGSMPQAISNSNRNFITSIMATENGTIVTVADFDTDVVFESPGGSFGSDLLTIFLNAGDTYVLTGYTTTAAVNRTGFIGAHITSNKDIAVNTGNYMGSIHTEGYQDGGLVQIVPTSYLGTEHVVVQGGGGPIMERPLVVATEDGTDVFINDIAAAVTTLNEGEYYLVPFTYYTGTLHTNMAIRTSQPVYVYQCTAATTSSATSEFNFIPPLECYLSNSIDAIPEIDRIGGTVFDGILYVITKAGSTVSVNGSVIGGAIGPEPAVGLDGWETYNMEIDGDVSIESTGAMAAGYISVNGFAAAGAFYAGFTYDFQVEAGLDVGICIGDSVLLDATGAGAGATYDWDFGVVDSTWIIPTETTVYNVIGTTFEDCADEDSILVTVFELPESDAGFDFELCDTNATTLVGNTPLDSGYGVWTMATGPGAVTFVEDSLPTTEVNGLIEGVYEFVWTVGNGSCPTITDTVSVTVYDMPMSNAGSDIDLCDTYSASLFGNTPVGSATGEWTVDSGPSVPALSDPGNPLSPISDLIEGTYTLIWTVSNGTCPSDSDTMLINVYDLPASIAGDTVELCGIYDLDLTGNIPVGTATGVWSLLSGPSTPTFADVSDPLTNVSDLEEGNYEFIWTVSNGTCTPATDTVLITIYDAPISNAGADQSLCSAPETSLTGNIPTGSSTGVWTTISGPTVVSFTDETDPGTTVSGFEEGTYAFVWTVSNGVCESATDTIVITINLYPEINILANKVSGCEPLEVAFTNLSDPIGDDCLWEFGDGTVFSGCGDAFHTYSNGTFDVTLTVTANGCTATETFTDFITSIAFPTADFGFYPTVIDITNTTVNFRNYSEGASTYLWNFDDEGASSIEFEPSHTYPESIDGLYEVVLIVENEFGCPDTAYGTIAFEDLLIFYVPNSFTPDQSGRNDTFSPVFTSRVDPYDFNMRIFNRWGEILFETFDMNTGWDGTYNGVTVQDGTYIWSINFGDTNSDQHYEYQGHVNVLR